MELLSMCRICISKDVRLHCLVNTDLQEIYEFLSGNMLETKDTRPLHACYMCCARLRNCLRLRTACLYSEELFSHLLENDACEITPSQDMSMLQTVPVIHINMDPVVHRELNIHPSPTTDEQRYEEHVGDLQDNNIDQGICTQFIKEKDVKSENISSEDEEIQSIKVENNSASDNSLECGTPEIYVSKSNHSISSVDLQGICAKTVKIVLHRTDLNTAAVTEHLNPTDLEYTSQCNNLDYSENVEMSIPNICEEYKQIHTSNETHCNPNSDSFKHIIYEMLYKCHICEKRFIKQSMLNVHIRQTHNDGNRCPTCNKGFSKRYKLVRHIRTHTGEKPYKCDTCGKGFSVISSLSRHTRIHTGEKPYKCDTCGKYFRELNYLSIHIRSHTGEKPLQCPTCGKCFNHISSLKQHIRTHTGEKPYKCDTCGKDFSQLSNLLHHIRIHTGVKPYQCDTCGMYFRHKNALSHHIRIHTGVKPYQCDTCGIYFRHRSALSKHIRKKNSCKTVQV